MHKVFGPRMQPVLQTTASECGLACLAMVAHHHGLFLELFELRSRFALSMRGMSMASMVQIATQLGLTSRPLKIAIEHIGKLARPCILHWDMNHFVVLVRVGRQHVTLFDPAQGEVKLSLAEFGQHFTGIALELCAAPGFKRQAPKPPVAWRDLMGSVVGLRRGVFQLVALAGALQVLGLVTPWLTQWVVDGAIVSADRDLLTVLTLGSLLLLGLNIVLGVGRSWCSLVMSTQISLQWSNRIMGHLLHLPATYFETRHIGDIVSRFQSLHTIQQTITGAMVDAVLDGVFALTTLAMLFFYSAQLGWLIVGALLIYAIVRVASYGPLRRASSEYLVLSAREQSHFLESIRAYQSVKIGGLQEQRRLRWGNLLVAATNRHITTEKMNLSFASLYGAIFGAEQLIVLWLGEHQVMANTMSIGMLMAFIAYKSQFSDRTRALIDRLVDLRLLGLQMERLADIVLTPQERIEGSVPLTLHEDTPQLISAPSRIELIDIGFRYGDGEPWILRHVNLVIEPGEHIAIVGPSGCGKSTLAKLIMGLLIPNEGRVLIDGIALKQLGLANWRCQLGVVMQDDQLFTCSLLDNIANFTDHVNREQAQWAAQMASVHEEIMAMPMGYQTYNGDMGSSLSGVQKQRVLLARALYKRPSVLLLDEATSHLDVDKEQAVGQAICALSVTRIVIAHRPETIKMADLIVDIRHIANRMSPLQKRLRRASAIPSLNETLKSQR